MTSIFCLANEYMKHRDALLIQWRISTKNGTEIEMLKHQKKIFRKKLRSIFPRGKLGEKLKTRLVFYSSNN